MTHSRTPDAASADLKKIGLKATLPRLKILRILEEAKVRHMTAEDVYKILLAAGEEVGLATVYRVLTQFEGAGLVIRHNFEGRARYSRLIKEATMTTWCVSSAARFSSSRTSPSRSANSRWLRSPGSWSRITRFTSTACARACANTEVLEEVG